MGNRRRSSAFLFEEDVWKYLFVFYTVIKNDMNLITNKKQIFVSVWWFLEAYALYYFYSFEVGGTFISLLLVLILCLLLNMNMTLADVVRRRNYPGLILWSIRTMTRTSWSSPRMATNGRRLLRNGLIICMISSVV